MKRLARVGYDHAIGYLNGGFEAWKESGKEVDTIETISVDEFVDTYKKDNSINVVDVRKPGEWSASHVTDAQHFALDYINENMAEINPDKKYYLHCMSGNRSTIACSILQARGFRNLINVHGKFDDIKESGMPMEGTCPSLKK